MLSPSEPAVPGVGVSDIRRDPATGTVVHVVGERQGRPNLPSTGCPFCVGGLEAPDHYCTRSFINRWPAMDGDRCEVVLYTPDHNATFVDLGVDGATAVLDLWAERTTALGGRDDVDYVLVFENRGAEVGATIRHPHGQIYAFDHVPARQQARLDGRWQCDPAPGPRLVATVDGWVAYVPFAPVFPVAVELAPVERTADLVSVSAAARRSLGELLVEVYRRLDLLFGAPLPYMMWLNQRPTVASGYDDAWFNIEIVSPWRAAGVHRHIAAAEIASGEYFNPIVPEELAAQLRALAR